MADLEKKIIQIVSKELEIPEDEITADSSFYEDLGADSLDMAEISLAIESEFDITLSESEAEQLTSVGKAIDFIKEHLKDNK